MDCEGGFSNAHLRSTLACPTYRCLPSPRQGRSARCESDRKRGSVLYAVTLESSSGVKILPQTNGVASDGKGVVFLLEGIAPIPRLLCSLCDGYQDASYDKAYRAGCWCCCLSGRPSCYCAARSRWNRSFQCAHLEREPKISRSIAPGVYSLHFFTNSRLLFGVSNFPTLHS